jgi:hypothetical protein
MAEFARDAHIKDIRVVLETRLGPPTPAITAALQQVKEAAKLDELLRYAVLCPSLRAFENSLRKELPAPPASRPAKRRSRKPPG